MKVLACGSRAWKDKATIRRVLKGFPAGTELIVGGAAGADRLAEHVGRELKMKVTVVRPKWDTYGRAAGFIRNEKMVDMLTADTDVVVAFWDGKSRGTAHTVRTAESKGIRVRVFSAGLAHGENGSARSKRK